MQVCVIVSLAGSIQGNYVASVTIASNIITVRFGNVANAKIDGETITLTANTSTIGSVKWICRSGGVIADKHLPSSCRP